MKTEEEMDFETLQKIAQAISDAGKLLECAEAIAEWRNWHVVKFPPDHPYAGQDDVFTTRKNWKDNLHNMLRLTHRYHYAVLDHRRVVRILKFDPLHEQDFDRAA